ncbi:MAG: oligosaccharide flippase family protein [Acidobacteriota bacterium]
MHRNLLANLAGTGWTAVLSLLLVPVYVRLLGIEAYGVVGFFTTLQAVLWLLDLGLSTSLNRQIAVLSANESSGPEIRNLVRTVATVYWVIAFVLATIVIVAAPAIAERWLRPDRLSAASLVEAIRLMGAVTVLQFPFSIYAGGLLGLQKHVPLNVVVITMTSLRAAATVGSLIWIHPSLQVFFLAQLSAWCLQTIWTRSTLYRSIPPPFTKPTFRPDMLRSIGRFAAGLTAITAIGAVLMQIDKIIVSRMVGLEKFGYYALASTLAAGLSALANPFFAATFPKMSQAVARGDSEELAEIYHRMTQLLGCVIFPLGAVLAVFPKEVLLIWTRDPVIASSSSRILAILALGFSAHALLHMPYALQLSHRWTGLSLTLGSCALLLVIPATVWASQRYGAIGAAAVWLALNVVYLVLGVTLTHRRILPGQQSRWYIHDLGVPASASVSVVVVGKLILSSVESSQALIIGVVIVLAVAAAVLATPASRQLVTEIRWRRS